MKNFRRVSVVVGAVLVVASSVVLAGPSTLGGGGLAATPIQGQLFSPTK